MAVGIAVPSLDAAHSCVLHPLIVGRAVHISPLSSLVAVLVGSALGGFVGAMAALPVIAVVRVLVTHARGGVDNDVGGAHAGRPR